MAPHGSKSLAENPALSGEQGTQTSLLFPTVSIPDRLRFDGSDYLPWRDDERLTGQLRRIVRVMADEDWHTLSEIAQRTGDGEASISAQLRHLRKPRFGSHDLLKEHLGNGLYRYRVLFNKDAASTGASGGLSHRV